MIDYRELPKPEKPKLLSSSRVILKIGEDYWAVDLGQILTKKRRLEGQLVPQELRNKKNEKKHKKKEQKIYFIKNNRIEVSHFKRFFKSPIFTLLLTTPFIDKSFHLL